MARGQRMPRPAQPLAAAIYDLVNDRGSHDKLAAEIGTTRATVISWEKGATPTGPLKAALIRLGVPEELWGRPPAEGDRFAAIERKMDLALANQAKTFSQIERLAKVVDNLTGLVEDALGLLQRGQPRKRRTG